jgi:hypothetical protein
MPSETENEYDVAISFLASDEAIAAELYKGLEGLKTFFFPRHQEETAGTDGLESMRRPFLNCRLIVILYRDRWGLTPWTGVEEHAIKDRCLQTQFRNLMFVQLEKSPRPDWLPHTHVQYNLYDFGIEQLIGAVKARIIENGGQVIPLDAISKAERIKSESDYYADRNNLMRDQRWIMTVVRPSIETALARTVELSGEVNARFGCNIKAGSRGVLCVLRSGWVTLSVNWKQSITNSLFDEHGQKCGLTLAEFSGGIALPGEDVWFPEQPTLIDERQYKPDVSRGREFVLKEPGKKSYITPQELPDQIIRKLLDLIERAASGGIEPPHI